MKYSVLILTDHTNHSAENSLYSLSVKMLEHSNTDFVDVATRANPSNDDFFSCRPKSELYATRIDNDFCFSKEKHALAENYTTVALEDYDLIWLRMPPPLTGDFLNYLDTIFSKQVVINNPKCIEETGSKEFLMNFPTVCPPMKICKSLEDIVEFGMRFPIVLKPFKDYGGRGIIKIDGEKVSTGGESISFGEFSKSYIENPKDYLGVKFMKNVKKGDKRIVVVNGKILGASLRLPAENSWLCNVAMGGSSTYGEVEPEEEKIIQLINPFLTDRGIVMYGVDTLMNDNGKRILSEINTTSIGGLPQIAAMYKKPLVEEAIDLIWTYFKNKTQNDE